MDDTTTTTSNTYSTHSTYSLKDEKELFVTGHDGTTPWEILLVSSAAPIGILLYSSWRAIEDYVGATGSTSISTSTSRTATTLLLEVVTLWFPMLICQTNLLYPWGVILLWTQLQLSLLIHIYFWSTARWMRLRNMEHGTGGSSRSGVSGSATAAPMDTVQEDDKDDSPATATDEEATTTTTTTTILQTTKDAMTIYRSSMMYMTFIAILAVDFHLFPRRFAKTEVEGYGLMDLGAGSFVVAAGFVSPRARARVRSSNSSSNAHNNNNNNNKKAFGKRDLLLRLMPLWIIGLIRLATNKGLEYQEHVSEYGVHWNFFFTLAFVTPVGSWMPGRPHWSMPVVLMVGYQCALLTTNNNHSMGGQDFIVHAARTHCSSEIWMNMIQTIGLAQPQLEQLCTLFAANREGVLGCIGYLVLYLAAEYLAYALLWNINTNNTTDDDTKNVTPAVHHHIDINNTNTSSIGSRYNQKLWIVTGLLWALLYVLVEVLHIPVSRRSTNASFCVWTLAHNMILLVAIHTALCLYNNGDNEHETADKNGDATTTPPTATPTAIAARPRVPMVFQAVNQHGLLAFLVANLLTGFTNLTINTLAVNDALAFFILFVYLCAVGAFVLVLQYMASTKRTVLDSSGGGGVILDGDKQKGGKAKKEQ